MNQANQDNNFNTPTIVPAKRKRGRPRKDQSLNRGENSRAPRKDQSLNRGENARVPPGFEGLNGNQPHQVDPIEDPNDVMVGQVVFGVVEAAFDAGYLLTVRVGDSDIALRGVVFKPGHYVPISAENDVAPNVQMIRRNEISLPTENHTRMHSHNPQSTGRNEQLVNLNINETTHSSNESPFANQLSRVAARAASGSTSKSKQVPTVAPQPARPVASRGNVVPVVLQPVHLSNGIPSTNEVPLVATTQAADHMVASKGKQVPVATLEAAHQSNGSVSANQMATVANQLLPSQPQTSHQLTAKGLQNENGIFNQPPPGVLHEAEAKSMRLPGVPLETMLGEVIKRIQVPSHSSKVESGESAGKLSTENCGLNPEEVHNINQPLLIKPLQAVQPDLHYECASIAEPLENNGTGKMTELLQENTMENKGLPVQQPATESRCKFHECRSPETEIGDEETLHSEKCSRASSV